MTTTAVAPNLPSIAVHRLPAQLRMLVRTMGEAAAYRFVQWRGGTPFTVPRTVGGTLFVTLADHIGAEPAARLVAELGGETMQVPKYDGVLRQLRHQRVVELRGKGAKLSDVALATGYTVRQVINILGADDPHPSAGLTRMMQAGLFDDDATDAPAAPTAHDPFGLAVAAPTRDGR